MLLAGYETTSSALLFLAYNLAVYKDCQEKVRREVKETIEQYVRQKQIIDELYQGSPNVVVRGPHEVIQNMSRAGRLTQCDCCGSCYILPNQQIFRKYCKLFFHH